MPKYKTIKLNFNLLIKTVITAAGLGSRLLPTTKEIPKEILPIFYKTRDHITTVPILQIIFEQLFTTNVRNFCFIVGREKRIIKNHFTPSNELIKKLEPSSKKILDDFHKKLNKSTIKWSTQTIPQGFGDAVKKSESFVGKNDFIVHAGDVSIFSKKIHPISRLINLAKIHPEASAILLCKKVKDTSRYGVPKISPVSKKFFNVEEVEEKPLQPKSNLAIMPLYFFKPEIFVALKKIKRGKNNEFQLTDAIQKLIDNGKKVLAIPLQSDEIELDVGTIDSYKSALNLSYKWVHNQNL